MFPTAFYTSSPTEKVFATPATGGNLDEMMVEAGLLVASVPPGGGNDGSNDEALPARRTARH